MPWWRRQFWSIVQGTEVEKSRGIQDLEKLLAEKGNIKIGVRETGWKVMDQIHNRLRIWTSWSNLKKSASASSEDTTQPFHMSKYSTHTMYSEFVICKYMYIVSIPFVS
jgi:hypothetical protein